MDHRSTLSQVASTTSKPEKDATRLHGPWLNIARGAWVIILILALLVVLAGFVAPQAFCGTVSCSVVGYFGSLTYGLILSVLPAVVWIVVGGVLFLRKSEDGMVWLVSLTAIIVGVCTLTDNLFLNGTDHEFNGPLIWQFAPLSLYLLKSMLILLSLALFPNGQFVPRWTRWVPFIYLAYTVVYLVLPAIHLPGWMIFNNPVNAILWFGCEGCLVVMQLYRFARRSGPVERQQIKWILFSFVVILGVDVLGAAIPNLLSRPSLYAIGNGIFNYSILIFPFSLMIALLRYRLWEIDILIRRTLVYSSLTVLLALLYVGLVFVFGTLLRDFLGQGQNPLVIVASTLLIAALFQPLRHSVQRVIDRRFYRRKYDAARTLQAFSATLRNEVDLATLSEQLVTVVQETMQPRHVSLWLCKNEQRSKPNTDM